MSKSVFELWVLQSGMTLRKLSQETGIPYWRLCRYSQGQGNVLGETGKAEVSRVCRVSKGAIPEPIVVWSGE